MSRRRMDLRRGITSGPSLPGALTYWALCFFFALFLVVGRVGGICVWQGGGGFRLACGFKQSGLLRMRSLGGLKGWAGAGFTIGDEDGFKDSLTNKESKARGMGGQSQYHPQRIPVPVQQFGQYSNVAQNQVPPERGQHESENLQKRASLWNSWKWPSIIKKKSPNSAPPQRMGPMPHHPYGNPPGPMYPQRGPPVVYPQHHFPPPHRYHQPYPHGQNQGFPAFHPPQRVKPGKSPKNPVPSFMAMPELDPLLNEASEEVAESQLESVLKVLKEKVERQRKRKKDKKPYGLQLLENSANYGKTFQVSENTVPAAAAAEEESPTLTGYDTNLFPDIYFTSTTPKDKLSKILEADEINPSLDQEPTTEAILRKLRLKKIKLLKKGHKLKKVKTTAAPKEESEEAATTTTEREKPTTTTTTERETTTTSKATTQRLSTSSKVPSTTSKGTTSTTRKSIKQEEVTTSPRPPMVMRPRPPPTTRPDYGDNFYDEPQTSEKYETWKEFNRNSPSPRPYAPIAQNPLILSGKWKDIYDPRYPPEHEVNRGKLELLAAALTTTSQRPRYQDDYSREEYPQGRPGDYFSQDFPRDPDYPTFPKRFDFPRRDYEPEDNLGLSSKVRVAAGMDGHFVKFDSLESLDLVNRTKSYNDAFYTHFNKSAMEIAADQPSPTPFHYFSAFYNQHSTPKPIPPPDWVWEHRSPSSAHFSRNEYSPGPSTNPTTTILRPIHHQWAGLGRTPDSRSLEDFRSRLDHSVETGELLRKKAMRILSGGSLEPGRGGIWEMKPGPGHPTFVTDDNFNSVKLRDYPPPPDFPRRPTIPPPTPDFYFSSTPSFNDWKNYVGAVGGGLSSTTPVSTHVNEIVRNESGPSLAVEETNPVPAVEIESKSDTMKQLPAEDPDKWKVNKSKPEVTKKVGAKVKAKVTKETTGEVITSTTKVLPVTTTMAPPLVTPITVKLTTVTESQNEEQEDSPESGESDEQVHEKKTQGLHGHPKKPAAAAFLPASGPSDMPFRVHGMSTFAPPVRLEPPPPPPPMQMQNALELLPNGHNFPSQSLGPPPPPPDFATSHLNEFRQQSQMNIQTDWNRHPLPSDMAPVDPPRPEVQPTPAPSPPEVSQGHMDNLVEPPQIQQRLAPFPEPPRLPPGWNLQAGHHYHGNSPPPYGPIPYPPPRPFSQSYPPHPQGPQNPPMGFPKPTFQRHMIPGRQPSPGPGQMSPENYPPQHPMSMGPPISRIMNSPLPLGPGGYPFNPPNFPRSPQIRPVQMVNLTPPPAPPQEIMQSPVTMLRTTTTPKPSSEPISVKDERVTTNQGGGDERDMILKALQTLTKAKSHLLHSVVNEKYGGEMAGIVKVAPDIPGQFRPTMSTTMTTPPPTTTTTTTPLPTTTVPTRIVFDEIPSKFVPLVNYVKKLKVPTYENDNVQIDFFNFKSDDSDPKLKMPALMVTPKPRPAILGLNTDDLALMASTTHQVQAQPTDSSKFEEMLRQALAGKQRQQAEVKLQEPPTTPVLPQPRPPSFSPTPLLQTLTQMGIVQKLQDRNISTAQMDTIKKLIELNKLESKVDIPQPTPPSPPPSQFLNNFHHILNQIPQHNRLGHRISHVDPSIQVHQKLQQPNWQSSQVVPSTSPRPFNSLYSAMNGPTLQALKAIALNQIQNVQPAPQINLPQQTAPEEVPEEDEITVDLSPLLGLVQQQQQQNKAQPGMKRVKVRDAPKSYYPGYRPLPFETGKEIVTNFQCEKQEFFPGLYGDSVNSCKVFHLCAKTEAGVLTKSFRCPQGTAFDQEVLRCNWRLYVNCEGVEGKYLFNKYLSQSFQFLKSIGEFSASVQPNSTLAALG